MPDGHEQQVNTEVDGHIAVARTINAISRVLPFGPGAGYTAGGGGEGGHFAISSLDELNALKTRWEVLVEKIDSAGEKLRMAADLVRPPAQDGPSEYEAGKTRLTLQAAIEHNQMMGLYAQGYVDKLTAAAADYAATEGDNTAGIKKSGD
ncbi:hypothetical protein ACTG9Q_10965 [Actinokineospora sp. 24-640]